MGDTTIQDLFTTVEGDTNFQAILPSDDGARDNVTFPVRDEAVQALNDLRNLLKKDASKTLFVDEIENMFTVFKDKIKDIKDKFDDTDDPGVGEALGASTTPSSSDLNAAQTEIKTAIQKNHLSKFVQDLAPEFYVYLDAVMTEINKMKHAHDYVMQTNDSSVMFTTNFEPEGLQQWTEIVHEFGLCTAAPDATAAPKCPGDSYCLEKLWVYVGGGSIGLVILILLFLSMKGGGRR